MGISTMKFLDPTGSSKTEYDGKLECTNKCSASVGGAGIPFTYTLTTGDILHGICGYTDQVQAETHGLYLALSDAGVKTPPTDWDSAMIGSNSSVYTYWKCSTYKAGTCVFSKPP